MRDMRWQFDPAGPPIVHIRAFSRDGDTDRMNELRTTGTMVRFSSRARRRRPRSRIRRRPAAGVPGVAGARRDLSHGSRRPCRVRAVAARLSAARDACDRPNRKDCKPMASPGDWKIPASVQPKPGDYAYDLDRALSAVVALSTRVPPEAFTAETLGTERAGNGVVIREDGL